MLTRGKADAKFTAFAAGDACGFGRSGITVGQDGTGAQQEVFARRSQADATLGALEQRRTDFLFQCPDLLAEWWLADIEPLGGLRVKMQFFGNGNEIT